LAPLVDVRGSEGLPGVPRILQWMGFTSLGMARESGGRKSPSGVQGQSPGTGRGPGRSPPEAEAKCEISVQLLTFPVENLRFNEYRNRAWTVYFANTILKKF